MTETTTAARTFPTMSDFVARAQPGQTFRDEDKTTITDYTVTSIEPGPGELSPEDDRTVVLDYVLTMHKGNPSYCYRSIRHTYRAWPTTMGYSLDLNMGQRSETVNLVRGVKRRSAKGLAAAHTQALAQLELTA